MRLGCFDRALTKLVDVVASVCICGRNIPEEMDLDDLPKPIEITENIPSLAKTAATQKGEAVDEEPKIEHIFPIVTILHYSNYDSEDPESSECPATTQDEVTTETTDNTPHTSSTSEFNMSNSKWSGGSAWNSRSTNSRQPLSSRRAALRTDVRMPTDTVSSLTEFSRSNMIAWGSTIIGFILFFFLIWKILKPDHPYIRH